MTREEAASRLNRRLMVVFGSRTPSMDELIDACITLLVDIVHETEEKEAQRSQATLDEMLDALETTQSPVVEAKIPGSLVRALSSDLSEG